MDSKKNKPSDPETSSAKAVENGRRAIDAAKVNDSKPPKEQDAKEKDDAETWRNEG